MTAVSSIIDRLEQVQVGSLVYIWRGSLRARRRVTEITGRYIIVDGERFGRRSGKSTLDASRYIGSGAGERLSF